MIHKGEIPGLNWIYINEPNVTDIANLKQKFSFHELVYDDLLEVNTQAKIDYYEDYSFVAFNVPKYNLETENYKLNEFDFILGKDYIIVVTRFPSESVNTILNSIHITTDENTPEFKKKPEYMLYLITDLLYDKLLRNLRIINKKLFMIQENLFQDHNIDSKMLELLMDQEISLNFIKHNILPHEEILEQMISKGEEDNKKELITYFQDLQFKNQKILTNINVLYDNLQSITSTYNGLLGLKNNDMIGILTSVTVLLGVVNFIGAVFGMNYPLPFQNNPYGILAVLSLMVIIGMILIYIFRKKRLM